MAYSIQHLRGLQQRPGARKGTVENEVTLGTFTDDVAGTRGIFVVDQFAVWGPEVSAAVMTLLNVVEAVKQERFREVQVP